MVSKANSSDLARQTPILNGLQSGDLIDAVDAIVTDQPSISAQGGTTVNNGATDTVPPSSTGETMSVNNGITRLG